MEVEIGRVTHYYSHLSVAVLQLNENLKLGDKIHILGHTTDFVQRVNSIEVEHHPVVWVKPGDHVAIKVIEPVREHDVVYRVLEGALAAHPV
jgi:putative protease